VKLQCRLLLPQLIPHRLLRNRAAPQDLRFGADGFQMQKARCEGWQNMPQILLAQYVFDLLGR
jgi:hypothetical protein